MKLIFLKTLVVLIFPFLGVSDSIINKAKEDFEKMNKAFNSEVFSVQMVYSIYDQHNSIKPIETHNGVFYKKGNTDYSKIMDTETIHASDLTIVTEEEEKIITINSPVSQKPSFTAGADAWLKLCKNISIEEVGLTQRKYTMDFNEENEFLKIEIVMDIHTYRLNKMTILYKETDQVSESGALTKIKPKLEINYKNYNKVVVSNLPVFSSKNYIKKTSDDNYKSVGKYTSFTVYNQIIK